MSDRNHRKYQDPCHSRILAISFSYLLIFASDGCLSLFNQALSQDSRITMDKCFKDPLPKEYSMSTKNLLLVLSVLLLVTFLFGTINIAYCNISNEHNGLAALEHTVSSLCDGTWPPPSTNGPGSGGGQGPGNPS